MGKLAAFTLALLLCSIATDARAELRVVTTTADLAAIAQQVGGRRVRVTSLALPTQDPHFVDARPHLALELSRADLLIVVGLDLEIGWLPTLQTGSRNGAIQTGGRGYLDCSQFVTVLEKPTGKVDRSQGDVHPRGSPHYLFDPRRATRVAAGMAQRMAQLDPEGRSAYLANARAFAQTVGKWSRQWQKQLAWLRGKKLIGYHRSFSYLADWLGFSVPIYVEPRPGIPPNPGHVGRVIRFARDQRVPVILQESWYPSSTSQLVARKTGAKLVVIPGAPNIRQKESYIGFINRVVTKLHSANAGGGG